MKALNKKAQTQTGLVLGLVSGIAFLIIGVIIAFVTIGTLNSGNLIPQTTYTVTNESDLTGALVHANNSGYSIAALGTYRNNQSFSLTSCWAEGLQSNGSATTVTEWYGYNVSLSADNCSLSSITGNLSNQSSSYAFPNVSISYTYKGDNAEILTSDNMTSNLSSGVQNVSSKIPTVLLIAAVILILAVLAVLVGLWQRMRMGSGGNL